MKNNIFIFSVAACPYAKMMKKWFSDKKIKIQETIIDDAHEITNLKTKYNLEDIKLPHLVINENSIGSYMDLIKQESFVFYLLNMENNEKE